jgi:hypothetical protein
VCFTYAGWFGAAALGALGHSVHDDPALARASAFIASKQRLDGGWGESYLSCQDKVGDWRAGRGAGLSAGRGRAKAGPGAARPRARRWAGASLATTPEPLPNLFKPLSNALDPRQVYSQLEGDSHVVNTAWAMMALMAAGYHEKDPAPLHK